MYVYTHNLLESKESTAKFFKENVERRRSPITQPNNFSSCQTPTAKSSAAERGGNCRSIHQATNPIKHQATNPINPLKVTYTQETCFTC